MIARCGNTGGGTNLDRLVVFAMDDRGDDF